MRAREFLLEYNRDITSQQWGQRIYRAFTKDHGTLPDDLDQMQQDIWQGGYTTVEGAVKKILEYIESLDPTANKAYTPWLAKIYASGTVKLEDLNRNDLLQAYDIAKKRRMLRQEDKDIMKFSSWRDFERNFYQHYNLDDIYKEKAPTLDRGQSTLYYEDDKVKVIVPGDQTAACYYGQGTRWCTAATRGENRFDYYNRIGRLFILLPKKPAYPGEKYQIQWETNQIMDEQDEEVVLTTLNQKFPELLQKFRKDYAYFLKDHLAFYSKDQIQEGLKAIHRYLENKKDDVIYEVSHFDDEFYTYVRKNKPEMFDRDLSQSQWVKVFKTYKPDIEKSIDKDLQQILKIDFDSLMKIANNRINYPAFSSLPQVVSMMLNLGYLYIQNEYKVHTITGFLNNIETYWSDDKAGIRQRSFDDDFDIVDYTDD